MIVQKIIANAVMKLLAITDSEKKRTALVEKLCAEKIVNPEIKDQLIKEVDLPHLSFFYNGAKQPPITTQTPDEVREMYVVLSGMFAGKHHPNVAQKNSTLTNADGTELPIAVFTPKDIAANASAIVFFPGGGFVIGSPETHAVFCTHLAIATKSVVISVEYRKGPEVKFPQGHLDCIEAWKKINNSAQEFGIDKNNIFVCGDSAGGNLSAVVAEQARRIKDIPAPKGQILIYPVTDTVLETDSYKKYGLGLGLTQEVMAWFFENYFGHADVTQIPAEELEAAKDYFPYSQADLKGIAPAIVLNAKFDPLLDDGTQYAKKLKQAGALHKHIVFDGVVHNFINMPGTFKAAKTAVDTMLQEIAAFVSKNIK